MATHAKILIDCEAFYESLHEAICRAKKSIIIVGWDIDRRVRLIRGRKEFESPYPSVLGELLAHKARENASMLIYLLRWDSSIMFSFQREIAAQHLWEISTPENVHICADDCIPIGGAHHQKIIIIDNTLAFSGGGDVAAGRWDSQEHKIIEPERHDERGNYGPFHDVQIMLEGPIVGDLTKIACERWVRAAGYEIKTDQLKPDEQQHISMVDFCTPDFKDVPVAIARTSPAIGDAKRIEEILHMYLDLITSAEEFLYLENQYLTSKDIARQLNQQLRNKRNLRAAIVSSFEPEGMLEGEALWTARIEFERILEVGIKKEQVIMCAPLFHVSRGEKPFYKRIHSKVMVIDDQYLCVNSSNITNRSLQLDTECDIVLIADSDSHRMGIRKIRNALIAEHSGIPAQRVQKIIENGHRLRRLLKAKPYGHWSLAVLKDHRYTHQKLGGFMNLIVDPKRPFLPRRLMKRLSSSGMLRNPSRRKLAIFAGSFLVVLIILLVSLSNAQWFSNTTLISFLEGAREMPASFLVVCSLYLIGGLTFFPMTILSLATTAVFGALRGTIYAMVGALLSAALLFGVGHYLGLSNIRKYFGERIRKATMKLKNKGVFGVAMIRLTPIAPYSLVNLAAGIVSIKFVDFMLGSFMGLLPGLIAKGLVGDSLMQVFIKPNIEGVAYLISGLVVWILLVVFAKRLINARMHRLSKV